MGDEQSQWLRGVTDLLLLSSLSTARSYGYELVERLRDAGLADLHEATVYGALRRMERADLLRSKLVRSAGGPARRYYDLTAAGLAAQADLATRWRTFVGSVEDVIDRPASADGRAVS